MGNLAQAYVKNGDWSARVDRQYVVAPLSINPKTGLPYEIEVDVAITEAPDWFVEWCVSQRLNKKETIAQFTTGQGRIRYLGKQEDEIADWLHDISSLTAKPKSQTE